MCITQLLIMAVFINWLEKFLKIQQLNLVCRYEVAPAHHHLGHWDPRLVPKEVMGISSF